MTEHTEHEEYVSRTGWLVPAGRADLIDEIADQFERPRRGAESFWTGVEPGWPARPELRRTA